MTDAALPAEAPTGTDRGELAGTLGWAAYLGCSWTWCIGMFLPVLLVRDYGLWGFAVFAVPNVVGAAAMGWVLRDADASRRFVERHRHAIYTFSAITIAFHYYWIIWLATWIRGATGTDLMVAGPALIGAVAVAFVLGSDRDARHRATAWGVWLLSIGVMVALAVGAGGGALSPTTPAFFETGESQGLDVLALAPVCLFGFAFCPYLDATFHRARSATGVGAGRAAFTIGFGLVFASMIGLTLLYAGPLIAVTDGDRSTVPSWAQWAAMLLVLHLAVQLVFTVRVHQHASAPIGLEIDARWTRWAATLLLAGVLLGVGQLFIPARFGMTAGELGYRVFISAYGLALPAYVWICAIPTRDGHAGTSGPAGRRELALLLGAVVIAAPMYWVGYIQRAEWWLLPGLAVLLLARVPAMLMARGRGEEVRRGAEAGRGAEKDKREN